MSARSRALAVLTLGLFWGGAARSATAQVSVATASPSAASQGTSTLTVVITGKNFVKNAKAGFYRTGTRDPGGVVVSKMVLAGDLSVGSMRVPYLFLARFWQ